MNESIEDVSYINPLEEHARTIIHIDIDCFYAQVEILKNPDLANIPLGIQQKNIVVTSNYVAREYGIQKCMLVTEAKSLCPQLVLVNGEDLKDYRETSNNVSELLRKFSPIVERLGLDENFIDITEMVKSTHKENCNVIGNIYGTPSSNLCYCGCHERLKLGTHIADTFRKSIFNQLGLTTCAGISYNKLLAKLVCATHKPNQQTVLYPEAAEELLTRLSNINRIPGIGQRTTDLLKSSFGPLKVPDILNLDLKQLATCVGDELANKLVQLCKGYDPTPVKITGKPQSIGLEDSFRIIKKGEVEVKFKQLLTRLLELVVKDGRLPTAVKVTVRKFDGNKKTSHREQKQCNISPSIFSNNIKNCLLEESQKKLLTLIVSLFYKIVDVSKSFHITLLGIAFTKFREHVNVRQSITSFLMKKNVAVQAITNISSSPKSIANNLSSSSSSSPLDPMDISTNARSDGSESEIEPSPKKTKFNLLARRRCLNNLNMDSPSPSKLRVADLRLNSREYDQCSVSSTSSLDEMLTPQEGLKCPIGVDASVFNELPIDVQQDVINEWRTQDITMAQASSTPNPSPSTSSTLARPKNSILNYMISNK